MPDSSTYAVGFSVAGRVRSGRCWPVVSAIAALSTAIGCRTAHYNVSSLPEHLRVPKAVEHNVKLAEIAAIGTRTTRIVPGDLLAITIASGGEDKKIEPVLARVAQNGSVNVPLIGEVSVADVQPVEAAERIAA